MSILTDRQRIELAIPAYLFYALAVAPNAFVPADPDLATKAAADVIELRDNLRTAYLEPFADLPLTKKQALERRLERLRSKIASDWNDCPALSLMLMLWYFLMDLTDREVLILWEGSAMARATQKLLPMCEHGFAESERIIVAQKQARALLNRYQAEGFYR